MLAKIWIKLVFAGCVLVLPAVLPVRAQDDDQGEEEVMDLVKLDPMEATFKPHTMTIMNGIRNIESEIRKILVGEVWMASGQKSYALKAGLTLNRELAHDRVATNIVFGDVWYVGGVLKTVRTL